MELSKIAEAITGAGGLALIVMTLIQITPIKINPWTHIAHAIGRSINGEVINRVDALSKDLQSFKASCELREAENKRAQILRFGDEILHGVKHSKEHFDQVLLDCTEYETYCREHPNFANNVAEQTIALIKSTYRSCMEEKSFL